jgi:CRISPR/Cas system-associated protein Cas10 (large subunit of type III CRISPR-Cas system)
MSYTEKDKARIKRYLERNPENRKRTKKKSDLKHTYGITLEQYNELVIKQNNKCAICGNEQVGKDLFIDHDHTTGKIRGLLCSTCNFAIGLLKDDPALCDTMATYLRKERE